MWFRLLNVIGSWFFDLCCCSSILSIVVNCMHLTQKRLILILSYLILRVLELHAPMKKKVLRANDKPYMTKVLRKAINRISELE